MSMVMFALSSGLLSAYGPPDSVAGGYRFCKQYLDILAEGKLSPEGEKILFAEANYDSLGRQIDRLEYESVGVVRFREIREYSTCGCVRMLYYHGLRPSFEENIYNKKCQKIQTNEYNTDSSLFRRIIFTYDSKSRLIDQKTIRGDSTEVSHFVYRYDSADRVCEELWLRPDGKPFCKVTRSYNEFGKEVEYKSYYEGTYCNGRTISKYNSNNELIEVINYDVSGNEDRRDQYRYDDRGNQIEIKKQLTKNGSITIQCEQYEYDSHGNITKKMDNEDGSITQLEQYEYDNHGNITIYILFNSAGQPAMKYTNIYYN